jgi:serine/threonine protein phosphatase PrpC
VFDRNVLFCANAGDSRAVLYSFDKVRNGLSVQSMSVDHKPEMTFEKKRIENKNGRVDSIRGMQGQ